MRLLTVVATLVTLSAFAGEELSPEKMAELQRAQKKAGEAVEKKYGNKKPSELSPDERKAMIKEKGDAEKAVLDKAGVDSKACARSGAKLRDRQSKEIFHLSGKFLPLRTIKPDRGMKAGVKR